ncbi:MAG: Hsp33 family molecular chaperone [Pseudomonadota bacterium]
MNQDRDHDGDRELSLEELGLGDDVVLPFRTVRSRVSGRLVRMGAIVDTILSRHAYPEPVSIVLGEALALTAMLGAALKFEGKLTLQTKSDGPLDFLVVDYAAPTAQSPSALRGYANFDEKAVADLVADGALARRDQQGALLGKGYLAMTIDQGPDMERYQGIVALEGEPLGDAAFTYFRQSEQLPTFIRLAVARAYTGGGDQGGTWQWRAGGLLVQHVSPEGGRDPEAEDEARANEERLGRLFGEDDESWQRVNILAQSVEDHELLDATLPADRLLYRLFHEEGVRASKATPLTARCRCSRERLVEVLKRFPAEDLADMRNDAGEVEVVCEFCRRAYAFSAKDLGTA